MAETKKSGFTPEERAAMKERAKELKANASSAEALRQVIDAIAAMPEAERDLAHRLHEIITAAVPSLAPRLWYGQPAYSKDGAIVCFFQNPSKFKTRYTTLGFNDAAQLDDGPIWPTAFAIVAITPEVEKQIGELVTRAAR
jgi:uncharacterized protein YdhG (YjbR/CyaY superfamily)